MRFKSLPPTFAAFATLLLAIPYGLVEWLALSRSRAADRLAAWRLRL